VVAVAKRKTSFEVDTEKIDVAKEILGTKTLTETVDAALEEIVKRRQRLELLDLLADPEKFDLNDPEVMRSAWRIGGREW
jgi:Arc/MetJ family transcription regulator